MADPTVSFEYEAEPTDSLEYEADPTDSFTQSTQAGVVVTASIVAAYWIVAKADTPYILS